MASDKIASIYRGTQLYRWLFGGIYGSTFMLVYILLHPAFKTNQQWGTEVRPAVSHV
jgi:hypothetical protein